LEFDSSMPPFLDFTKRWLPFFSTDLTSQRSQKHEYYKHLTLAKIMCYSPVCPFLTEEFQQMSCLMKIGKFSSGALIFALFFGASVAQAADSPYPGACYYILGHDHLACAPSTTPRK
ncbi:hypothetical protein, partial [Burkholderia ubonensis]|uniref:hypothetical protein n=1 Tax=Burkholderia ubonensis TaxID=101571 RepID=UPI001E398D2C